MKSFSDDIPDAKILKKNHDELKGLLTVLVSNNEVHSKKMHKRLVWNSILLLVNLSMSAVLALILAGIL